MHQCMNYQNRCESLKQEVLKSWKHYQETGLHVTGEEVKAWLKTWGTDHEQEAPSCHH